MLKYKILALALGLGLSANASAGLVITAMDDPSGPDAAGLVNTMLGGGISVSNISYTGAQVASGTFSGGTGILGIESGIVLTSGDAHNVIGPNNVPDKTGDNGLPGSALLDPLIPGYSTNDATVLSFDFVPNGNFVTFKYVFGSEEYDEYVGTAYNDVFAFFVNGVNYALIPGTSVPVAINNVNPGSYAAYFIHNDEPPILDTQLDGLTTVLSIVAPVMANQTNTMTLAIADAGDYILDSAVFIAGGTFTPCGSPGQPACDAPEPDSLAIFGLGLLGLLGVVGLRRRQWG